MLSNVDYSILFDGLVWFESSDSSSFEKCNTFKVINPLIMLKGFRKLCSVPNNTENIVSF